MPGRALLDVRADPAHLPRATIAIGRGLPVISLIAAGAGRWSRECVTLCEAPTVAEKRPDDPMELVFAEQPRESRVFFPKAVERGGSRPAHGQRAWWMS